MPTRLPLSGVHVLYIVNSLVLSSVKGWNEFKHTHRYSRPQCWCCSWAYRLLATVHVQVHDREGNARQKLCLSWRVNVSLMPSSYLIVSLSFLLLSPVFFLHFLALQPSILINSSDFCLIFLTLLSPLFSPLFLYSLLIHPFLFSSFLLVPLLCPHHWSLPCNSDLISLAPVSLFFYCLPILSHSLFSPLSFIHITCSFPYAN